MDTYRDDAATQYSSSENIDHCAQAIRKTLVDHSCGGFIVVVSPDGAASFSESPPWAGIRIEAEDSGQIVLHFDARTVDQIESALHFLTSITHYCFQFGGLFRHFVEQCRATLKEAGIDPGDDAADSDELVLFSPVDKTKGN